LLANITEQVEQYNNLRRPRIISESLFTKEKTTLYTTCSFDGQTDDKLVCSLSVLPQVDQLPNMFIYVPLQRNFLVRFVFEKMIIQLFGKCRLFLV
jgi:hypothetical protein